MASRGTSTGLGEQKKKSSPISVPAGQRRRAGSKDRGARTKTTAGGAPSSLEPPNMAHKFGQKPTLKAPAIFKVSQKALRSDDESERGNKSPSSDDGNHTDTSGSVNMFHMSDVEKALPASGERTKSKAKAAPTKGGSSKAAEQTPAEKSSAQKPIRRTTLSIDSDSDSPKPKSSRKERHGTGEEKKSKGKKATKDPAKAGASK